jgi:hypothetical protein
LLPHDLPPWAAVYQQMRRWIEAGCFEALADVQSVVRLWAGRKGQPTAICLDSRTLQSTPESGVRAGYDGAKRRKGSKVYIAVDTLGHLLALTVTPADQGDREQVVAFAAEVQQVTGNTVELAFVDQGYTGPNAAEAAAEHAELVKMISTAHLQGNNDAESESDDGGSLMTMNYIGLDVRKKAMSYCVTDACRLPPGQRSRRRRQRQIMSKTTTGVARTFCVLARVLLR